MRARLAEIRNLVDNFRVAFPEGTHSLIVMMAKALQPLTIERTEYRGTERMQLLSEVNYGTLKSVDRELKKLQTKELKAKAKIPL